jgi:hypothetical protein
VARRIQYNGYVIISYPELGEASRQWKLRIAIFRKVKGMLTMEPFFIPNLYNSAEEADIHGITYGQRFINEKVPGLKVG